MIMLESQVDAHMTCLHICMHACSRIAYILPAKYAYLLAYMYACLHTCTSASMSERLPAYTQAWQACIHRITWHKSKPTLYELPACMHACSPAYMHACMHACATAKVYAWICSCRNSKPAYINRLHICGPACILDIHGIEAGLLI